MNNTFLNQSDEKVCYKLVLEHLTLVLTMKKIPRAVIHNSRSFQIYFIVKLTTENFDVVCPSRQKK